MDHLHPTDNAAVLAPAPVFFGAAVATGFSLEWLFPTSLLKHPYSATLGLILIAAALILVLFAVLSLVKARTAFDARKPTTSLVTTGIFGFSRNPTYLSLACLQVGLGFLSQSLWVIVTAVAAVAITHWGVILREERYLERKFGEEYRNYVARVRRWL